MFMKSFSTVLLAVLIAISTSSLAAQTILATGDLAFTGYASAATNVDSFSFVVLVPVAVNTVITFTDNAWLSTNAFRTGEQTATCTVTIALVPGREVLISGTTFPTVLAPTATTVVGGVTRTIATCTGEMTNLSTSGDQVFAVQGATIISGIHMNSYSIPGIGDCDNSTAANWDPTCVDGAGGTVGNTNWSRKPAALTTGTNAIWIGEEAVPNAESDNAKFNCTGPLTNATQVRSAVNNRVNWPQLNGAPPAGYLPTNCSFFGLSPTAAQVGISGRVTDGNGRGVKGSIVSITDAQGVARTAITSPFGYYRLDDLTAGSTYVVSVASKRYQFTPQVLVVADQLNGVDFVALSK